MEKEEQDAASSHSIGPPDVGVWVLSMCFGEHGAFAFPLGEGALFLGDA